MRRPPSRPTRRTRALALAVTLALLGTLGALSAPPFPAAAAGTVLFQNTFANRTVDGTGTVVLPTPVSGPNAACLTASGNTTSTPPRSCSGATDAQGSGKLRLTNSTQTQVGGVAGQSSFPTSNGLDVTFNSYQWGGGGADGLAFLLAAVDPANPIPPAVLGPSGGALGYSTAPGVNGLTNAYLGVGLDVFGNFSSSSYGGTGCAAVPNIGAQTPGAVVVRGPGSAKAGYCGLATSYNGSPAAKVTLRATTRAASVVPVQVLINPTGASFTSDTGVAVAAGTYKVVFTPVGQPARTLTGALPSVVAGMYPAPSWLNANGVPKQLAFGFVGSTGSVTDVHEVGDVRVLTFNPVPQLAVSTTSYAATTSTAGDPVTYRTTASVAAGANVTGPVSVTQSVPAGVVPLGAFGTGWDCDDPVGRSVTCTTTASSFAQGTTLPVITTVAIVTASSVAATLVQSASPAQASSANASPGADVTTTAGALPTSPSGISASPVIGPVGGGGIVLLSGSNITAATAIEIGTTAEMQAGTPVVLLPCPGNGFGIGCFTVNSGLLVISSMPARATPATTLITVVTAGVAGSDTYVYADRPAVVAAPTAVAGTASATVTWTAPASNGSAVTGYHVTPIRNGVAQTAVAFDATATSRTLTGLTAGASYTFTVTATNAYGTSAASAPSAAVVPYALPGAPTISATTAGTASATLTWTTPSNGGGTISGYVVTPYVGDVAQPTQLFGTTTTQIVTGLTPGTAYTFTVSAVNQAGTGPASARSPAITPNRSPSLSFAPPPAGEVGAAYSQALVVTDGTAPFAWSLSSGTLPAGLTLNASSGLLSGTPTTAGTLTFTVRVVDGSGEVATRSVTLVIAAAPALTFTPAAGEVGVAYSQQPIRTGGTAPFSWSVSAGSLPPGLTLGASTGTVAGTPTTSGTFPVTIRVTDGFGQAATRTVSIVVVAQPTFVAAAPPAGQVGVVYGTTLSVDGGTAPLTWALTTGSLPPGLTLATGTGVVSGTPTTAGSATATVTVTDANGQSAAKTVTIVIGAGPLVIVKAADVSTTVGGATVHYTVTISNTGSSAWTGATLRDPLADVLDDATYSGGATATAGTVSYASSTLTWTGTVPASGSVTISYSVTVKAPDLGDKVLAGTVTSTTLGTNCAVGSADPRCSAPVTVAGLTIVTSADVATTTPGSLVRVTIVITNTGPAATSASAFGIDLAGMLDDGTYTADATATTGSLSYTRPTLSWSGQLAAGQSATVTFSVRVADPVGGDRSLTGTVVSPSAGSPCPGAGPAPSCTVAVPILIPALSITTQADRATVAPGGVVAYTVTLANTGQTPAPATTVRFDLSGALDDATYAGGATASAGSLTFDAGTSTLVWTGDLAIGAEVTLHASVTVRQPDAGDRVLTTVARSSAPGSTCPTGGTSPSCTSTVPVRIPELTLVAAAGASTTAPGSAVSHTVTATNTGQTPYVGATFAIDRAGLLDDATVGTATATSGQVATAGGTLSWTGDLLVGATVTVTYTATVHDPDAGDLTLVARVSSTTAGATCPPSSTDPRCASSVAVLVPALSITTESDAAAGTTTPGSVVHYTVTVANTGASAYAGLAVTLDLVGALDDADYDFDATITTGELVTRPDGTVDWVLDLAPGAHAVGTVSLTVKDPAAGDRTLEVVVVANAAGSPCPTGSTAPGCRSVVTVLVPGLTITKTADVATVVTGGTVAYTITVVNDGETSQPAASLTDDLDQVLTDATYAGDATATSGAVAYDAPVLSWTGPLAPGASATITYSVTVRDPDPGDKTMNNSVVSSSAGSNCRLGSVDARCTVVVQVLVPGLTIVAGAGAATTTPNAVVTHTITITNTGTSPSTGATVSDSLADVLDDATYNADAAASAGSVAYAAPTLTWTGDLAVGASATVTYTVTVNAADVGNDLLTAVVTSATRGSSCLVGSTDPRCSVTVPVARLTLSQSFDWPTTTPGSVVRLNGTFTNTGQVPYTGISVSSPRADIADDATATGDQTATSGTLVLTADSIVWTGAIPVGGTVGLTGTITVHDPDLGNRVIRGTMTSTAPGSNCAPGSADTRCTALLTVLVPGLTVTKTADTTTTGPGDSVGYTITVHNSGQTPYVGASVVDALNGVLGNAAYDGDATATSGSVTYEAPVLTWTGDLAVGATATVTYTVTVGSTITGEATLFNEVRSSEVGSTCPPATGNAACRTSVAILTPGLTITSTTDVAHATLGTTVTGTVVVANTGQTDYAEAAFAIDLAAVLDDATADAGATTATSGTVGLDAGTLSWSGALAVGASATVTYAVTIDNPATGDLTLTATAISTNDGSNCATGSGDVRCSTSVAITDSVSLTFTKTADVESTVAGGVVEYTVTIANTSEVDIDDVDLTDPWAGIVDDATYGGDALASGGTLTENGDELTWLGTVPALSTVTITYSFTVGGSLAGDELLSGTISSTRLPASDNCTAGSTDPRCTSTVPVAALRIVQSADVTTARPGSLIHLTAVYTNLGQVAYQGISIASPRADTSDDTIPTGDQTATSGLVVRTPEALTWTGSIPVGGSVTVLRSLRVKSPNPGNGRVTATVTSAAAGSTCGAGSTDPGCTFLVDVVTPGLTISKTADTTFVVPGGSATYTITVTNSGQTPYAGAVVSDTLAGVIDDATYGGGAVASGGIVTYDAPVLTWTGDLAVGASATITYAVTARAAGTGDKTMINPVSSTDVGSTCPPATSNPACRSAVAVLTPALTVTMTADATTTVPGATVTYTVTATNSGQIPFGAATFSIPLAGALDDATLGARSATTGTVGVTGSTLTWTGALGVGATSTTTYALVVDTTVAGDHLLVQAATSATAGASCPVGGADPRCRTSVAIAGLGITNTADVATTTPTSVVRNTLTITNTGQVPYVGITVSDSFVGSLDDATYNGDASTSAGSLVLVAATGRIEWTGDLAVGATVTVTGTLTVKNPDLGDRLMTSQVTTATPGSACPASGPAPACSSSVTVLIPGLAITMAADTAVAGPGSTVVHTVTATNTGETPYVGAVVRAELTGVLDDASYDGALATTGTVGLAGTTLTWTGDLAIGETVVITIEVTVHDPDLGDRLMVGAAVSSEIGSSCPPAGTAPSCTSVVIVLVPRLDITIGADRTTTVPGATVGYTITIHNSGQTDSTGAAVAAELAGALDDAGPATALAASVGEVDADGTTVVWTGDLSVGATATVTYELTVDDPDAGDRTLATSVSSATPGASCPTATPCTSSVTVLLPGLAVTTEADVLTATPGDLVRFTITVTNTGETPYPAAAVATDLADIVDDATLTGTVVATTGVATYEDTALTWEGALPVGAAATITYEVTVRTPDPGDLVMATTVTSAAAGSTCPAAGADPGCTATVTILVPALAISVSAASPTTTPGATVGYTVVIANTGQTAYEDAVVDIALDGVLSDAEYGDDATVGGPGTVEHTGTVLRWTGDLALGASATVTYTITVDDPDEGGKAMVTTATSTTPGSTCPPGGSAPACSVLVQVLVPSLTITKTADRATVTAGSTVTYTITVLNDGETDQVPASFVDHLSDVVDDATFADDATATTGAVATDATSLTWTGGLTVGETATITYSVTTSFPAEGDLALVNTVLSDTAGSACTTLDDPDGRCRSTVTVLVPAIEIVKTADAAEVVAGGSLHYTISATNTGQADDPDLTLTDTLTGVLDDAGYDGDAVATSGTLTYGGGVLEWSGSLARGETVTVGYSVTAGLDSLGDAVLVNAVSSDAVGSTCVAGGTEPGCRTETPVAPRSITISGLTSSFSLDGPTNTTVGEDGAVTLTVATNSASGYVVTVQAGAAEMTGTGANTATIAIDRLHVRESGQPGFRSLSASDALVVHAQDGPSSSEGDAVSNDYEVDIPFVPPDTYGATLEYVVSAQ